MRLALSAGVITLALRSGSLPARLRSLHAAGAAYTDVSQQQQTHLAGGLQPGQASALRHPGTTAALPAWPASPATSRTFSTSLPAPAEASVSSTASTAPASHQPHAQRPHRVVLGPFPDLPRADQPSPGSPSASATSQSRRPGRRSRLRTESETGGNAGAGISSAAAGEAELEQAAGGDPQVKTRNTPSCRLHAAEELR